MDEQSFIQTALQYGKGPIIRGLAWAIATLLASHGVTSAQAGDYANSLWPSLVAILTASVAFYHSVSSDRRIATSATPSLSK